MPFSFLNTVMSWFLKKRIHQIELFMKYPIEVQNETLINLLKTAKKTEFGKKRNAAPVSPCLGSFTPAPFQRLRNHSWKRASPRRDFRSEKKSSRVTARAESI